MLGGGRTHSASWVVRCGPHQAMAAMTTRHIPPSTPLSQLKVQPPVPALSA